MSEPISDSTEEIVSAESVVQRLVRVRHIHQLTQAEMAARMRVSQATVAQFERGVDPRLSTVQRYARALGAVVTFDVTANEGGE